MLCLLIKVLEWIFKNLSYVNFLIFSKGALVSKENVDGIPLLNFQTSLGYIKIFSFNQLAKFLEIAQKEKLKETQTCLEGQFYLIIPLCKNDFDWCGLYIYVHTILLEFIFGTLSCQYFRTINWNHTSAQHSTDGGQLNSSKEQSNWFHTHNPFPNNCTIFSFIYYLHFEWQYRLPNTVANFKS